MGTLGSGPEDAGSREPDCGRDRVALWAGPGGRRTLMLPTSCVSLGTGPAASGREEAGRRAGLALCGPGYHHLPARWFSSEEPAGALWRQESGTPEGHCPGRANETQTGNKTILQIYHKQAAKRTDPSQNVQIQKGKSSRGPGMQTNFGKVKCRRLLRVPEGRGHGGWLPRLAEWVPR